MFPTKFTNDGKFLINSHNALCFVSGLPSEEVFALLKKKGISEFVKPDIDPVKNPYSEHYTDKRVQGHVTPVLHAGCCSFTKSANQWYLFPIHRNELASVGLDEKDLKAWVRFLLGMKIGLNYKYLGEHELNVTFPGRSPNLWREAQRAPDNKFYWIACPAFPSGTNRNLPYLNWICIRYLFNSNQGSHLLNELKSKERLMYYNIPRIAMFLHKTYGLTRLRAFLYAHVANPFYSGHGLAYTDYMGKSNYVNCQAPCLNIKAPQFKKLLETTAVSGAMNTVLTKLNFDYLIARNEVPEGLEHLNAPYDANTCYKLFDEGDYVGFIKHIDDSYNIKRRKKNAKATK
jgi:hypothetical protein